MIFLPLVPKPRQIPSQVLGDSENHRRSHHYENENVIVIQITAIKRYLLMTVVLRTVTYTPLHTLRRFSLGNCEDNLISIIWSVLIYNL